MSSLEIKKTIEIIILESYNKSKEKNFQDFNFVFPKSQSVIAFLKDKLKIFHNLDVYSRTFLSIHTKAKSVLRELKTQDFEGNYLELLRLIFTLSEELKVGKLKSINVVDKEEPAASVNVAVSYPSPIDEDKMTLKKFVDKRRLKTATIISPEITGKKIVKQQEKQRILVEEFNEIDFEDEEFKFEEEQYDDLELQMSKKLTYANGYNISQARKFLKFYFGDFFLDAKENEPKWRFDIYLSNRVKDKEGEIIQLDDFADLEYFNNYWNINQNDPAWKVMVLEPKEI